jgi:hypothetical protein
MRQMKSKRTWIVFASVIGLLALAAPGFAWWGYGPGYEMMGSGYGPQATLASQQNQGNAVQSTTQARQEQALAEGHPTPVTGRYYAGSDNAPIGYRGYGMAGGTRGGMMYGSYGGGGAYRGYSSCGW